MWQAHSHQQNQLKFSPQNKAIRLKSDSWVLVIPFELLSNSKLQENTKTYLRNLSALLISNKSCHCIGSVVNLKFEGQLAMLIRNKLPSMNHLPFRQFRNKKFQFQLIFGLKSFSYGKQINVCQVRKAIQNVKIN